MFLVLKPGGWMVNLDTCPTPQLPGMRLYIEKLVPLLGRMLARDEAAYRYLSESTREFWTPEQTASGFEAVGCRNVLSERLLFGAAAMQAGQKPLS